MNNFEVPFKIGETPYVAFAQKLFPFKSSPLQYHLNVPDTRAGINVTVIFTLNKDPIGLHCETPKISADLQQLLKTALIEACIKQNLPIYN